MIDLTKPIRRKNGGPVAVSNEPVYRVDCSGAGQPNAGGYPIQQFCTLAELERDYENIPEPRKPREWQARYVIGKWELFGYFGDSIVKKIRVIEWPEGKPLPDWPEE